MRDGLVLLIVLVKAQRIKNDPKTIQFQKRNDPQMLSSPGSIVLWLVIVVSVLVQWTYLMKASVSIIPFQKSSFQFPKTFACMFSTKGGKVYGGSRDCREGQGTTCSKEFPCTPCDSTFPHLLRSGLYIVEESCTPCSVSFQGECGFQEDFGPYCNISNQVKPCERCCTPS